jgi:hypothetical protein
MWRWLGIELHNVSKGGDALVRWFQHIDVVENESNTTSLFQTFIHNNQKWIYILSKSIFKHSDAIACVFA